MKKIMMIAGLFVLVAGAAVGGLMVGKKQAPAAADAAKTVDEEVAADAEGAETAETSGEEPKPADAAPHGAPPAEHGAPPAAAAAAPVDLVYQLDKFTTNLSDSLSTFVQMKVEVEAPSAAGLEGIKKNLAPLRDATIMVLSSKTREDLNSLAGKERLKRELMARYQGVLSSPKHIKNVYLTDFTVVEQK